MMASLRFGFIVLSMPKCASSSLQQALMPVCDVRFKDHMKHVSYAFVTDWVLPMMKARRAPAPYEPRVFSLVRDPIDWLYSWYRYSWDERGRPTPGGGAKEQPVYSTFASFLDAYFSSKPPRVGGVLRQSDFLRDRTGALGEVELFRLESHARLIATLETLSGQKLDVKVTNQSRARSDVDFEGIDLLALRRRLASEYELYDAIPAS
ncbi:hypothetical protein [Neoroseomonas soli]|uniref:Sulfotransferase family protein n=1 Tax=Neoroseomonas soli TaxID=1081025 RepID=A0A9X9WXJ7_9PROT|nr:hypothetical protein [Neoroseomonas soli]MBR0671876.1 hypothetical protein [Neoroseomonas soli]